MDKSRIIKQSTITGVFGFPIGIRFRDQPWGTNAKCAMVSTVDLQNAHLDDPLGVCAPETGFETAVFIDGYTHFSVFTKNYRTRQEATRGHSSVVKKLLAKKLPLAVRLYYYPNEHKAGWVSPNAEQELAKAR